MKNILNVRDESRGNKVKQFFAVSLCAGITASTTQRVCQFLQLPIPR